MPIRVSESPSPLSTRERNRYFRLHALSILFIKPSFRRASGRNPASYSIAPRTGFLPEACRNDRFMGMDDTRQSGVQMLLYPLQMRKSRKKNLIIYNLTSIDTGWVVVWLGNRNVFERG